MEEEADAVRYEAHGLRRVQGGRFLKRKDIILSDESRSLCRGRRAASREPHSKAIKKHLPRVIFLAIVLGWVALFAFSSPEALIDYIGIENGYVLVLALSFISGLSIFGLAPYHLALLALAAGGLNPFLLAFLATLGLGLGDSTSYLLGYHGRAVVPRRMERAVAKLSAFLEKHDRLLPAYIFLYGAAAPFSNDFVGVTLGLARYPFWRVMVPLSLGTLLFNTVLALSAPYAYELLLELFQP